MTYQNSYYRNKVQMTKQFVMKYLKYPLVDYIEKHHWKETIELCRNLIDDKITEENKKYLEKKLGDLGYLKEKGRSNEEYALNLILGWAVEDAMLEIFNETLKIKTSLNSADQTREFLKTPEASSDFIISHKNQEHFVEIVSDYNGFWKNTFHCHLRDNKFLNVKAEDGIIFGNDYKNNKFLILKANSIEDNRVLWKEKHKAYGGKPAYEITLKPTDFYQIGDIFRFIS